MQYYRRKPPDDARSSDRRRPSVDSVATGTRQWTTTPAFAPAELSGPPSAPANVPQVVHPAEPGPVADSLVQEASALVQTAAAILDEEMAAGVLAAREHRSSAYGSGTSAVRERSATSNQQLSDLNAIIEEFADLIARSRRPIGTWLASIMEAAGYSQRSGLNPERESVAVLRPRRPVPAGGSARIALKVHNDDEHPANFTLRCSDLVGSEGYKIPDHQAVLTPREVHLGPDASAQVYLDIGVPPDSPPGAYSGLLTATGLPYLHAVVTLEVEQAS